MYFLKYINNNQNDTINHNKKLIQAISTSAHKIPFPFFYSSITLLSFIVKKWCKLCGVFLLQDYSCTERSVSADRGGVKSIYSFPCIGTEWNSAECVRALNTLNALKDKAEGNGAINNYSHKCLGKPRCKLFQKLKQPQLPSYSQTCSFHQDHWCWSDAKKEGPDSSNKHKQMVQ